MQCAGSLDSLAPVLTHRYLIRFPAFYLKTALNRGESQVLIDTKWYFSGRMADKYHLSVGIRRDMVDGLQDQPAVVTIRAKRRFVQQQDQW